MTKTFLSFQAYIFSRCFKNYHTPERLSSKARFGTGHLESVSRVLISGSVDSESRGLVSDSETLRLYTRPKHIGYETSSPTF